MLMNNLVRTKNVSCRWRMHIRKALSPSEKTVSTVATENEGKNEEDEDDRVLNEMEELTNAIDRKKKRERKLLAKRRAKVCGLTSVLFKEFLLYESDMCKCIRSCF